MNSKISIRNEYQNSGVENFYKTHAQNYQNPHFPEIEDLLTRNFSKFDTTKVLDFSAGGGEVSQVFQKLGVREIVGCDPFTFALFEKNTRLPCLKFSFKDVIRGVDLGHNSLIVSSFALHLCPEKDLFPLVWNLLEAATMLVIITPHKRPELEKLPGIRLIWEDFSLTGRGKKVRLKVYQK